MKVNIPHFLEYTYPNKKNIIYIISIARSSRTMLDIALKMTTIPETERLIVFSQVVEFDRLALLIYKAYTKIIMSYSYPKTIQMIDK